jgi:hypothetical protein
MRSFFYIVLCYCDHPLWFSCVVILGCYCISFSAVDICRDSFASSLCRSFISFSAVVLCRGSLSSSFCVVVLSQSYVSLFYFRTSFSAVVLCRDSFILFSVLCRRCFVCIFFLGCRSFANSYASIPSCASSILIREGYQAGESPHDPL